MYKKIVSTILILVLCITNFNINAFSFGIINNNININLNNFGKVTSANFYNSDTVVINIQDLHANKQVQNNIYNILKSLTDKYKNVEIFLEGASKLIQFDNFINNVGKDNSKLLIENLYNNSDISGAEYFAYKNNKILYALEDKTIYSTNIKNYASLLKNNKYIVNSLNNQYLEIKKINKLYLTKQQIDIIKYYNKYLNNNISFLQFYNHISKYSKKQKIDISKYPELKLYLYLLKRNNEINETKVKKQLISLISYLKSHLPYNEYEQILKISNDFSNIDILLSYLLEKSYLNDFPQLSYYVQLKNLSSIIEPLYLVEQEKSFVNDLLLSYSKFSANRDIVFINMFFEIYKNVVTAQASYDDYVYYKYSKDNFKNLYKTYVGYEKINYDLDEYVTIAENFNNLNDQRNNIFINKLLSNVDNKKITSYKQYGKYNNINKIFNSLDNAKYIKVIVTGGFHTLGINKLLDDKKVSYITITPNVSNTNLKYKQKYEDSILLQTDIYSNAIAGQPLFEQESQLFVNNFLHAIANIKLTDTKKIKNLFDSIIKANNLGNSISLKIDNNNLIFNITTDLQIKYTIIYDSKNNKIKIQNNTTHNSTALGTNIKTLTREVLSQAQLSLGKSQIEKMLGVDISKIISEDMTEFSTVEERINALLKYDSLLPKFADDVISAIFKMDMVEYDPLNKHDKTKYELIEIFKDVLSEIGGKEFENSKIIIGRSNKLVGFVSEYGNPENYGCLVYVVRENNKAKEIYISEQLLNYMNIKIEEYKNSELIENSVQDIEKSIKIITKKIFRAIIVHERLENIALEGRSKSFNKYAKDHGYDRLSIETFHKFILSEEFNNFFDDISEFSEQNIEEQKKLLNLLNELIEYINGKKSVYSNAISVVNYNGENYEEQKIQDFIDIRVSLDIMESLEHKQLPNTLQKYIDILAQRICEQISKEIQGDDIKTKLSNYCLAYRNLQNQKYFDNIVLSLQDSIKRIIAKKENINENEININIVKIDEQIDTKTNTPQYCVSYTEEQKNQEFDISDKKIFYIDDILSKQSATFYKIHEMLTKKENASKVQSCVFFDLSQEPDDKNLMSDDAENLIKSNPEILCKLIERLDGKTSKYVVPLLFNTYKYYPNSFNKIIENLSFDIRINIAKRLAYIINNNIPIKDINNNDIFALMICLTNGKYINFSLDTNVADYVSNVIDILEEVLGKTTTNDNVFSVDYDQWKGTVQFLVIYAKLRGYNTLNLTGFSNESEEIKNNMFEYAKLYEMVIVDRKSKLKYEHQNLQKLQNKKIRTNIDRLQKELSNERKRFDNGINIAKQIKNIDKQLETIEKLQSAYYEAVKKIMKEVQDLVVEMLKDEGIPIDEKLFLVVVGGSLVKGNMKSDSDIYYDVIVPDGFTSITIEQHFTPLFFSILHEIGLNNYHTLKYSTSRTTRNNINTFTDEREIVNFLNYEPLYDDINNELYEKYMNEMLSETLNSYNYNIGLMNNIISYYHNISKKGYGKFGKYSFLYSYSKDKSFTTKWILKTFETFLNIKILEYLKNNPHIKIQDIPKSVKEQILFIKDHNIIEDKKIVDELYKSWKILSSIRYLKKDCTWTITTQEEKNARIFINNYILQQNITENTQDEFKNYSTLLEQIESFLYDNSKSTLMYRKSYDRYANLDKWMNFDKDINGVNYFDSKNMSVLKDFFENIDKNKQHVFINGKMFKVVNKKYIELQLLNTENKLKIYRDGTIIFENNGKEIQIRNRKDILNFDCSDDQKYEIMEILDTFVDPVLLWNKAKIISLLIDIDSLQTREQLMSFINKKEDKKELENIFKSLDKIKTIEKFPDIVDLEGERSLQNYWDSIVKVCGNSPETFFALLSHKLTEVKYSQNSKDKAVLFSVYLPLSKRLGMAEIYENVRNIAFESTNPTEYLNLLKILEAFFGDSYSHIFVLDEKVEIEVRKILQAYEINLDDVEITSRVKTLYSIYEKLTSTRRAKDVKSTEYYIEVLKAIVEDIEYKMPGVLYNIDIDINKIEQILQSKQEFYSEEDKIFCIDTLNKIKNSIFSNIEISKYFEQILINKDEENIIYIWIKNFLNSGVGDIVGLHVVAKGSKDKSKVLKEKIVDVLKNKTLPSNVNTSTLNNIKYGKKNNSKYREKFKAEIVGKRRNPQIELCVYTKQDHDKETYGVYNTEGQTKRPHNIYKVGKEDKNTLYLDNIFPVILDLNYFNDIKLKKQIKNQTFVFESDNFVPNNSVAQNYSKVYSLLENKVMCIVEFHNKVYIVALPQKSTIFDLVSCKEFSNTANMIVYDENGNYVEPNTKLNIQDIHFYRVFNDDYPIEAKIQDIKTIRGKLIYNKLNFEQNNIIELRRQLNLLEQIDSNKILFETNIEGILDKENLQIENIHKYILENDLISDIDEQTITNFTSMLTYLRNKYKLNKISLYNFFLQSVRLANHYNLKDVIEFFEAIEYKIIDIEDIKHYFYTEYVFATETTKNDNDDEYSAVDEYILEKQALISKLNEMFELKKLKKSEYSKYIISMDGVKYSINNKEYMHFSDYQIQQIILNLDEFKKYKGIISFKVDFIKSPKPVRLISLGNNIEKLIKYGNIMYPQFIQQIVDDTASNIDNFVTSMKVLLGLYSTTSQSLSNQSSYITQQEIENLEQQIVDRFKQKGFNVSANIKISNTQTLVLDSQTYSFATLQVEKDQRDEYRNITVFINEQFIKEVYKRKLDMQEILSFVVEHELEEYEYIMQGKTYKDYHAEANENQQNLLNLCNDIAKTISQNYVDNAYNEIIDFFNIKNIGATDQILYECINTINDYIISNKDLDFNILKSLLVIIANMNDDEKVNILSKLKINFKSKELMLKSLEQYSDINSKYLLTEIIELLFIDPVFEYKSIDNDIEYIENQSKSIQQLLSAA